MKLLLAGGGTAGHIEPALAVARKWQEKHPNDEIIFLGTAAGLEQSLIPAAGFQLTNIPKVAIARSLSPSLLKVPFLLISAIFLFLTESRFRTALTASIASLGDLLLGYFFS